MLALTPRLLQNKTRWLSPQSRAPRLRAQGRLVRVRPSSANSFHQPFLFRTALTHPEIPTYREIPQVRLEALFKIYQSWGMLSYQVLEDGGFQIQLTDQTSQRLGEAALNHVFPGWVPVDSSGLAFKFAPNLGAKNFSKRLKKLDGLMANHLDDLYDKPKQPNPFGRFTIHECAGDAIHEHPVLSKLKARAGDVHAAMAVLKGPTIFYLDFGKPNTRVVSVAMHANEPSSFVAFLDYLQNPIEDPDCNIVFVIHNVWAAQLSQFRRRFINKAQWDRNRKWIQGRVPTSREVVNWDDPYVQQLFHYLEGFDSIEGIVDIHNTSGQTPPFSLVASLSDETLQISASKMLASHFAGHFFHIKVYDAMCAVARYLAPSVAVELGKMFTKDADLAAIEVMRRFLALPSSELISYQTVPEQYDIEATFKVRPHVQLAIASSPHQKFPAGVLALRSDIEQYNFKNLAPGEWVAVWTPQHPGDPLPFRITSNGGDVTNQYIEYKEGVIYLKTSIIPLMATLNLVNIVQSDGDAMYVAVKVPALSAAK